MSSFHRNNDDLLRDALSGRFRDFEPEAPELLDAVLERVSPPKNGYRWYLIKSIIILGLLLQQLPLSVHQMNSHTTPILDLTGEDSSSSGVVPVFTADIPTGTTPAAVDGPKKNTAVRTAPKTEAGETGPRDLPVSGHSAITESSSITTSHAENALKHLAKPLDFLDPPSLIPLGSSLSSTLPSSIPLEQDIPTKKQSRFSFSGGIGLTNTQYIVTILSQNPVSIQDMKLPGFWRSVNWKPQVNLGVEYNNWQLQLNYREFSQRMEYWVSEGAFEVDYQGNEIRSIRTLVNHELESQDKRLLGLSVRKAIPLKRYNAYAGLGGGYQLELGSGNNHSLSGQLFTGQNLRLNNRWQLYVEGQFNFFFNSIIHRQHQIYSRPYQFGLSAGVRWNK